MPRAIAGTQAGAVFGNLVRMNDGARHADARRAVVAALQSIDGAQVAAVAGEAAAELARGIDMRRPAADLSAFAYALPAHAIGALHGVPPPERAVLAGDVQHLVRSFAPAASPPDASLGAQAAGRLLAAMRALRGAPGSLAGRLDREAARAGIADGEIAAANAVGFFTQAHDATAGLIGNAIVALARDPARRAAAAGDPSQLAGLVRDVMRDDPPVQNTRRFLAADAVVAGASLRAGDTVLVLLAAAGRDPAATQPPAAFGVGRHACPGAALACTIAEAGLRALLAAGLRADGLGDAVAYYPSANTRVPRFGAPAT